MKVLCTDLNFPRHYVPVRTLGVGMWFELDGRANLVIRVHDHQMEVVTFAPEFVRTVWFRSNLLDIQVNPITVEQIDIRFIRKTQ